MNKPKFQVGDLVRVREDAVSRNGVYFDPAMEEFRGKEFVIRNSEGFIRRYDCNIYGLELEGGNGWRFREDWLDPVEYQSISENENEAIDGFLSEFQ